MKLFGINYFSEEEANVVAIGIDYTKDSKEMLEKIRYASNFIEPFDIFEKKNLFEKIKLFDKGNLKIESLEEITKIVEKIKNSNKVPLILSRGHLPTYFSLSAFEKEKLLVFDAHADCKNEYIDEIINFDVFKEKEKFNGATWLRRFLERKKKEVFIVGLRSLDEDEMKFLEENKIYFAFPFEIENSLEEIKKFAENSKIYISFDLDVLDPSIFSATDYPEPEGISFDHLRKILANINSKISAIDVCCFNPKNSILKDEMVVAKIISLLLSKVWKF